MISNSEFGIWIQISNNFKTLIPSWDPKLKDQAPSWGLASTRN